MNQENFDKYISERYYDQIKWYSGRSSKEKIKYMLFQWLVIILSTVLPTLTLYLKDAMWIATIASVVLAVCATALKTFKYQEMWVSYRATSEMLKKEWYYFDAGLDEYGRAENKEELFVSRVERLISRENLSWASTIDSKQKKYNVSTDAKNGASANKAPDP